MYGLDGSPDMLAQAEKKGVYNRVFKTLLGPEKMPTELLWDEKTPKNSGVDLVVCSDSMLDGNLPENIADDVMKVLRPGGHFAFTIRECEREKYLKGIQKLEAYGDLKQVVHKKFKSTLKDEPSNVYVF